MKIVVTTHGEFCFGLKDTLTMMCSDLSNISFVSLSDAGQTKFEQDLLNEIKVDEEVIVLTDLQGGSPYLTSLKFKQMYDLKLEVVAGVNYPMLLDCYFSKDSYDLKALAEKVINSGIEGIIIGQLNNDLEDGDE